MAKTLSHKNFFIREYRNGDFTEVKHLWSLTEMDNPERGDDEKTIKDTIKLGGSMLILEEKNRQNTSSSFWNNTRLSEIWTCQYPFKRIFGFCKGKRVSG